LILVLGSAPVGLLTGMLAWLAAGGASASATALAPIESQLAAHQGAVAPVRRVSHAADDLLTMPLFVLTTGPNAVADPALRLDGLSRSPRRVAALVSINGRPASWMVVGEEQDGVVLREVTPTKVVMDTPTGPKELVLGEQTQGQSGGEQAAAQAPLSASAQINDQVPAGFKSPPPPASAPVVRR